MKISSTTSCSKGYAERSVCSTNIYKTHVHLLTMSVIQFRTGEKRRIFLQRANNNLLFLKKL